MAFLASLVGSSSLKAILIGAAILAIFIGGAVFQGKIDAGAKEAETIKYEQAISAANQIAADQQHGIDQAALAASDARSQQMSKEAATLSAELADVHNHVSAKIMPCIPYGFVRLHDAAVLRVAADSLALPAGKSDNSCSPFTATQLAEAIIGNYNRAIHNANQLNALIAYAKQVQAVEKTK
jgi:hypothetical protein